MAFQSLKDQGISVLSPANLDRQQHSRRLCLHARARHAVPTRHRKATPALAIRNSQFVWLHAPEGYIGTSGALEIGYAHAHGVPVYTTEVLQDVMSA
jgi:hypothetical protein